ncbi:uncharacterized protein K452DRAFT_295283 [Aplosporella prunicola CBS 121167]|uniref:SET domain-containing protein n=1 Tax=Aplosporella prunicola CBS 121167 TaxID=1176127 RepID=A0A6A6BQJ2_9PEZI|nr:uncharacterized protein K452DRAFT_295283 [Aplosporella prunicola CBS 121167]KAF2145693.1 hypothetical protein K452DRAFT_295283 [Aplosporella prunicola CBS 121167]
MPTVVLVDARVDPDKIIEIVAHRTTEERGEEYLVRWVTESANPTDVPFSYHDADELASCLPLLQVYLESLDKDKPSRASRKRKHDERQPFRPSPAERLTAPSRSSPASPSPSLSSTDLSNLQISSDQIPSVYNGTLRCRDEFITMVTSSRPDVARIDVRHVPTPAMTAVAQMSTTLQAQKRIRDEVVRRLDTLPGPRVTLVNTVDSTSPPLDFQFIAKNILGEGVYAADPATRTGCSKCKAHMGQGIGCEYSKICDCLEYAAVHESERMLPEERERWEIIKEVGGGDTAGLPKKFPYYSSGARQGCLVPFYLERRFPIYECNENCQCGPGCKTRIVQFGRQVRLEIFRTSNGRGWGLRCKQKLMKGQFIDTYRGEIITDAEATRREKKSIGSKDSYLYSLDKFAETLGIQQEDLYVIDGQYKGGPTRFINHSCEPNCRQYVVSYNRHDPKVYEIAFFATRDISAGEELTFDYLDKDEEDEDEEEAPDPEERKDGGIKPTKCRCGAKKCRKWLWI